MDETMGELNWLCEKYHMTRADAIEILKLETLRKIEGNLSSIEAALSELTSCEGTGIQWEL